MDSPTLNMVQNQIAPNGVTHEGVLEAFLAHDRASYLPPYAVPRAYADDNVTDKDGRALLLRPTTLALMIQHLARREERGQVAVIGDATGYIRDLLSDLGFAALDVADEAALAAGAPWQAILLNGAVPALPDFLFAHLEERGVVLAIRQPEDAKMGDIVAAGHPRGAVTLGQAGAPCVPGLVPEKEFAL